MEIDKILIEQKKKGKEQKRIKGMLAAKKKIWQEVKTELNEISEKFSDKRRTQMQTVETVEFNAEDFIEHEDVVLVMSRNGWLRKIKTLADPTTLKFKENDSLLKVVRLNTRDLVAIFTSLGMAYVYKAHNLPYTRSGFGEPVQSLFKFGDGERVIQVLALHDEKTIEERSDNGSGEQKALPFDLPATDYEELLAVNNAGYGFRFPVENLTETSRAGKRMMTIKKEAQMVTLQPVTGTCVFLLTEAGKGMLIKLKEVTQLNGPGVGVKLMNVGKSVLLAARCVGKKDKLELVYESGKSKEIKMTGVPEYKRGSQGVSIVKRNKVIQINP